MGVAIFGSQPNTIRSNVGAAFAGTTFYALSQWGVLILLARLGGPDEVGLFALALAITTPIFMLTNLNLRQVQASDASIRYQLADYLGVAYLSFPFALALSIVAALIISGSSQRILTLLAAVAGMKLVESVGLVLYGYYQRKERLERMALSLTMRALLGPTAFGVIYLSTGSMVLSVLGMGTAWLLVIYNLDARGVARLQGGYGHGRTSSSLRPRVERKRSLSLARLALPVGISAAVMSLTTQVPRYVIELELGSSALGVFASLAYGIRIIQLVTGAMGSAVVPRLAKLYLERRVGQFVRVLLRMLAAGAAAGVCGVIAAALVGEDVLAVVYGEAFARGELLVRLMVAALFLAGADIFGAGLMGMGLFRIRMSIIVSTALVVSAACVVLVPDSGLLGAGGALIVGFGWYLTASIVAVGVGLFWLVNHGGPARTAGVSGQ